MTIRIARPLSLLVLASLLACSDSSSPVVPGEPHVLRFVEGSGLQAPAGTVLPEGPTVEVLDGRGDPVPDVTVSFAVVEGGGESIISTLRTNGTGRARGLWILGPGAGSPQAFRATVGSLSADLTAEAITPIEGEIYVGRHGYIEYFPGTLPVVLSAPHGGALQPSEIPDRTSGTVVTDLNTVELILLVRDALHTATGAYPHVVVSLLDRVKLDPNREIVEAAQGNPEAQRAWWEYHTFIDRAEVLVEEAHGEGIYIDLHGHGHEIQRLELGYLLTASALSSSDQSLAGLSGMSSYRALGAKPGADFVALVRGPQSIGSLMESEGFPAVPSQNQPSPGVDPYFTGGYSTAVHGSRNGGSVSGLQIECNYTGVRDSDANRRAFAEALARTLSAFFDAYMEPALAPAAPGGQRQTPFRIPAGIQS